MGKKAKRLLLGLLVVVVMMLGGVVGLEVYTSQPAFCGSCHIMERYHATWEASKHAEEKVACFECHYAPGEHHTLKAKFKGLGQLFSYLGTGSDLVQKATFVDDRSCTTSECHPMKESEGDTSWLSKKIGFAMYTKDDGTKVSVPYVHKTHFKQESWMEGQERHCSICHRHHSSKKHMEVTTDVCALCHFKDQALNKDRAKCSLCHDVPTKPFRASEESQVAVTHQILEKRGVSCTSCHLHHVRGDGKASPRSCLRCHEDDEQLMAKAGDRKIMHETHVPTQAADCFDCHDVIEHRGEIADYDQFEASLSNCRACHSEPHSAKAKMIAGTCGKGIEKPAPIKHYGVEMSCMACHVKEIRNERGHSKRLATPATCIACHTEEEGKLIEKWKEDTAEFLEEATETEAEALAALAKARGTASAAAIAKAEQFIRDGQHNRRMVLQGGGVHNKKYAVLLLDVAVEFFDEAVAVLEE